MDASFWLEQARAVLKAIHSADLREHELRVCDAILAKSLLLGRRVAVFALETDLAAWTDIRLDHVGRVVKGLKRKQVLKVSGTWYGFCLPTSRWIAGERVSVVNLPERFGSWKEWDAWLDGLSAESVFKGRMEAAARDMFPEECLEWSLYEGNDTISSTRREQGGTAQVTRSASLHDRGTGMPDAAVSVLGDDAQRGVSRESTELDRSQVPPGPEFGTRPGSDRGLEPASSLGQPQARTEDLAGVPKKGAEAVPNFGTARSAPKSGTSASDRPKGCSSASSGEVPNFGTRMLHGTLEDASKAYSHVPSPVTPPKSGVNSFNRELFSEVVAACGPRWSPAYKNLWVKMVNEQAEAVETALGELKYAKTRQAVSNPGAYLLGIIRKMERERAEG